MSDILPVCLQNFLYCRKSELREQIKQIQSNQLSSGVKSAAYSYDKKFSGKDFQKDESDSQISEQWL